MDYGRKIQQRPVRASSAYIATVDLSIELQSRSVTIIHNLRRRSSARPVNFRSIERATVGNSANDRFDARWGGLFNLVRRPLTDSILQANLLFCIPAHTHLRSSDLLIHSVSSDFVCVAVCGCPSHLANLKPPPSCQQTSPVFMQMVRRIVDPIPLPSPAPNRTTGGLQ